MWKESMTYFISDLHAYHKNIIKYCSRPFKDINEMNETMVTRWNSVVQPKDLVIFGGDFALTSKAKSIEYCSRLNGRKIIIKGNHDPSTKRLRATGFDRVYPYMLLNTKYGRLLIIHDPYEVEMFYKNLSFDILLYGHKHENLFRNPRPGTVAISMCVEHLDYTPHTLQQLLIKGVNTDE